ncbi:threonine/serine dehydratase [Altererythrobacter sp. MTPC7]|uniref:threonine ammonia-lyase n=1 Tax=Altererythrobacter sp. MTPC7 TaxID=3056567 RepID=UPI0036F2B363
MIRTPRSTGVHDALASLRAIPLPPTPLLPLEIGGVRLHAKVESLQPVGAFKIRGAWWRLTSLSAREREDGVVAVSSGNHAQGVAWAAKRLGIEATIVMPRDAPPVKIEATKALGAKIVLYDRPGEDRDEVAATVLEAQGGTLVHAFGDPWVIEGQGTAGLETAEQLGRNPSRFVVCCGGGGLAAGLALACPDSAIVPVEPEGWDMLGQALRRGEIVSVGEPKPKTICDALQPDATKPINLGLLLGRSDPGVTVSDEEVREAQRFAFSRLNLVVEPGGAAALAAVIAGKVETDSDTVVMLTGGNVDPERFARTISTGTMRGRAA